LYIGVAILATSFFLLISITGFKMKKLFPAILLFVFSSSLFSTGLLFHGSAKNSIYSFESKESHTKIYQFARFNVASKNKNIVLFSSMRALTDANETLTDDDKYKVYSLGVRCKNIFNRLELSFGRQFLHPGTILGALDGLNGNLRLSNNMSFQFYGGVEGHFGRSFKVYEKADSHVSGGLFQISKCLSSRVQLLYLRKENENDVFWNIAGANLMTALIPKTVVKAQAHYDVESERMHRLLLSARNSWSQNIFTTLEYKSQHPQIYANSYYTIFEPKAYDQYRIGAAVKICSDYYIDSQFQMVNFEDDNANRFFLSLQNKNGSLGFVLENGYAGDQLGLMFDYAYPIMEKLTASVYLDYSKYRTEEIYEYENQLANAARLSYRLNRHLAIDVEYQWLTNRLKDQDSRFLNHISYIW
jgi:hypothetical protein